MPSHVCNDILNEILDYKKQELIQQKQQLPLAELKEKILVSPVPKNFLGAIEKAVQTNKQAIIAEIKKASPSKGLIRKDFDPIQIALTYEKAGATCLSILTDEKFFQGHSNDLIQVRKISNLPILRKDFIIDEYQIYQSRLIGADCILLIVAALTDQQLYRFTKLAQSLNLSVLVEVHDRAELDRALLLATPLIGINNRNLHTFTTTLQTTLNLIPLIPKDKLIISESGMHAREDIELLSSHGVHAFLIGETFMRADDPGKKLQELFG